MESQVGDGGEKHHFAVCFALHGKFADDTAFVAEIRYPHHLAIARDRGLRRLFAERVGEIGCDDCRQGERALYLLDKICDLVGVVDHGRRSFAVPSRHHDSKALDALLL